MPPALTVVPLGVAFVLARRPPSRRYANGHGRAEDLAGVVIVGVIAASATPARSDGGSTAGISRSRWTTAWPARFHVEVLEALARAVRRAGQILVYPAGWVLVALWRRSPDLPRRVPNLARFTRSPRFRRLHADVATWSARHFEIIEANAPWLSPAGQETVDFCRTDLTTRTLAFPPDAPSVQCQRVLLRIYGADGPLSDRLGELARAVGAVGWGTLDGDVTVPLAGLERRDPPTRPISWRPVPGFGLPEALRLMPVARQFPSWRWVHMQIGWVSRGQSTSAVTLLSPAQADRNARRSPLCEPLEAMTDGAADPAGHALAAHEHAVALRIEYTYYVHLNATRGPASIAPRLLPYRPSHHRR